MSAAALAQVLRPLQDIFDPTEYPDLIVGLGVPDDAAVWRLDDDRLMVVTTDFFTPVVDEPYDYGAIAAANALSDLYAMGATPFLALNIAAMPKSLPMEIVTEIMLGGAEKVREAGAVIAGGHTIKDDEPKYGLVAIGTCSMDTLMTKSEAKPGDILLLTKPLGTGVTTTALKNEKAEHEDVEQATSWMLRLNAPASEIAKKFGVRGATDITGFGLLGHALEMAQASQSALRFSLPSIPFLAGARRYADGGNLPGGSVDNRVDFGDRVTFSPAIDEMDQMLLFDAQTSGGLLLSVPEGVVSSLLKAAQDSGLSIWPIGVVEEGEGIHVESTTLVQVPSTRPDSDGLSFVQST